MKGQLFASLFCTSASFTLVINTNSFHLSPLSPYISTYRNTHNMPDCLLPFQNTLQSVCLAIVCLCMNYYCCLTNPLHLIIWYCQSELIIWLFWTFGLCDSLWLPCFPGCFCPLVIGPLLCPDFPTLLSGLDLMLLYWITGCELALCRAFVITRILACVCVLDFLDVLVITPLPANTSAFLPNSPASVRV